MSGLRWTWSREGTRGWWIGDQVRARIVADDGAEIAELPGPAARLVELDDELLAIGDDRVWRCLLRDGSVEERPLPAGLNAHATITGVGGRRVAWIRPGDHAVRIVDLDTSIGLQLWPLEGRVSHHQPQLAVSGDRRTLVWCHVIASIDRFDLHDGGYPRSLAQPPEPDVTILAAVFPAEFAAMLAVFDDGDVGLARALDGELELRSLAGDGDRPPACWMIPGAARPLQLARGQALVIRDRGVERWSTELEQPARLLGRCDADGAVSGRLLADGRAQLGDASGRAWIATLEGACEPS